MTEFAAPPASLQVTINGQPREIFMSFNRLNRLTYLVGQIDGLANVMLNPEMRMAIILDLAQERDDKGKVVRDYTEDDLEVSQEDALNMLDFAQGHILDFFVKAAAKSNKLVESSKVRIAQSNLIPTPTGPAS